MLKTAASVLVLLVATALGTADVTAAPHTTAPRHPSPGEITVHEWGTFTTVAGEDGRAIDWLPLGGPSDLPCFVEHFQNNRIVKLVPGEPQPVNYETARGSLLAKVRMETPVLYFYAPRETSANVRIEFPRGFMSEWYPHATVAQPTITPTALRDPNYASVISWQHVKISPSAPAAFPVDAGDSHYYKARETDAAPLAVNAQNERFLFYRGVADFDVPLSAAAVGDRAVKIRTLGAPGSDELPGVVLFENHNGALGYRAQEAVRGEVTIESPALSGSLAGLRAELERMLVKAGLYPKEAAAMVNTWRDSWFEEGTRVFYIVPPRAVESILPLQVEPKPVGRARVFVGRMEVITPAVQQAVETAIAGNDARTLERYGRFLGPITDRILARAPNANAKARIRQLTDAAFASYVKRVAVCE